MRASVFVVAAMSFALPCMVASALVASADEGSPTPSGQVDPRIRPPSGVLRHVDAPTAGPVFTSAPRAKELGVFVGGYQSCAGPAGGTFGPRSRHLPGF